MNKYLLEIGVEEFPAGDVKSMLDQLNKYFSQALEEQGLSFDEISIESTPRRFAVLVEGLKKESSETSEELRGPALRIAYNEMQEPSKALLGFLKSQAADLEDIIVKEYKGEDYIFIEKALVEIPIEEILRDQVPKIIRKLNSSKTMKWGGKNLRFARPIRYFLSLYNDKILDFDLEGIRVSNKTKGHRDLGSDEIVVTSIDKYESLLKENGVILKRSDRKRIIKSESSKLAKEIGGQILFTDELVDELTDINEYPTPLLGSFDERYLDLPDDLIVTVMVDHQRYFALVDDTANLLANFIAIRNGGKEGLDNVRQGNERVIEPRLKDGEFFFKEDLAKSLEDFIPRLETATYHEGLGSIYDKTMRLVKLTELLGNQLACPEEAVANAKRAAYLSKADLVSNLVSEFTELQGTMGRIYALESGEKEVVAKAIEEQYMPIKAGSDLPQSTAGMILSIADKIDSIASMYAVGHRVTGSQDPFALRRAALGIINIILDKNLDLDLEALVTNALYIVLEDQSLVFDYEEVKREILEFFRVRFRTIALDQGYRYDIVDAVLATKDKNIYQIREKIRSVTRFLQENESLLEAITRVENISKDHLGQSIDPGLFSQDEERVLYDSISNLEEINSMIDRNDYDDALDRFSLLSQPINDFLDNVMVMVDEEDIRSNRLSLLNAYYRTIKRIFIPGEIIKE